MGKDTIDSVMGKEGEGIEGGKAIEQVGKMQKIKKEPSPKPDKLIVTVIIPTKEVALIP